MKALILVDLQTDFLPGGTMPLPGGDEVIPIANQLQGAFKLIIATQCWHPANHTNFADNYPGKMAGEVVPSRKRPRLLWPEHCVQNTRGAEFASRLSFNRVNKVFRKGVAADLDSFSGFFDQDHQRPTGLGDFLKEKKVEEVYLLGFATDYAVKRTALDAVMLGFKTFLIKDACCGVNLRPEDTKNALAEMKQAGVTVVRSEQVLQAAAPRPRKPGDVAAPAGHH